MPKELKISDHDIIFLRINRKNRLINNKIQFCYIRDKKRIRESKFEENLMNNWINMDESVDEAVQSFYENINRVLLEVAPVEQKKVKSHTNKWFDSETKQIIKLKNSAYNKAILENLDTNWEEYRAVRNYLTKLLREKKNKYFESVIDHNKGNSK